MFMTTTITLEPRKGRSSRAPEAGQHRPKVKYFKGPQAGTKRPAPQAGRWSPAPQAGRWGPAPQAGWRHPASAGCQG